ncbi:MAG: transposase [Acetobacteraceae bacterium]|nr:transposase [Acetobacteraceae bacterium]
MMVGPVVGRFAMTLIQAAKLNGVNPMAYLADVLECIVSGGTKQHELHTLLPWNWTAGVSTTIR